LFIKGFLYFRIVILTEMVPVGAGELGHQETTLQKPQPHPLEVVDIEKYISVLRPYTKVSRRHQASQASSSGTYSISLP
jgi:hypothetical protein